MLSGNTISDSGGFEGSNQTLMLGSKGGTTLTYSYEHYTIPDNFIIRYEGANLLETGFVGGSRTGKINVPKGNSDSVQVIVATNDSGTAWEYTVSAEDCPPTTPYVIELAGGDFTHETGPGGEAVCKGTGTIYIGRTDGIAHMIRVENATVEFDKTHAKVSGTVFAEIGAGEVLAKPLFTGSFDLAYLSGTASVSETSPNAAGEYQVGGMDVDFSSISINRGSLSLGASFKLVEELGTPDYLFSGSDGLIITPGDVQFGASIRFSTPNFKLFDLFGFLPVVEINDFSMEYIAAQDTVKIQGKVIVDMKSKASPDPKLAKITADLSGDNYIQIQGGKPDIKGELSVETNLKFPPKGWGLAELKLAIDTIKKDVSGSAKLELPFGAKVEAVGEVGFKLPIPPLELNKLALSVDRLNVPVPAFPEVFFQAFRGAVENFAESDPDPIEFSGGASATLGPLLNVSVSIPALDLTFGGEAALIRLDLDGKINDEMASGTAAVTLLNSKIAKSTGTATLNWKDGYFEEKGTFSLLDGLVTTTDAFKVGKTFDISMGGSAGVGIPKSIPLFGGAQIASGSYLFDFSNNGSFADDFVAGWGTLRVQKLGFDLTFVTGFKVYFDGHYERIGAKNIPGAGGGFAARGLVGSMSMGTWNIAAGSPYAILGADWDNDVQGDVPVRVLLPDGTWVEEADFAAHNIAVVDELTDSRSKVVILFNPEPGLYSLEVVDPTGLDNLTYNAAGDAVAPTIAVTAPAVEVPGGLVTIDYAAADPDSAAEVELFYDNDDSGFDGIRIVKGLAETDGPGTYSWNTQGLAPGTYHVYAMVSDGDNPPVYAYAAGSVQITESANLSASADLTPVTPTVGDAATFTFTAANSGPSDAQGVRASASVIGEIDGSDVTFGIALNAGDVVVLTTATPSGTLDPALQLVSPGGTTLATDSNGAGDARNARIAFTATETGVYLVRASAEGNTTGGFLLGVVIDLGTLASGQNRSFGVRLDQPGPVGPLEGRFEVRGTTFDPDPSDDVALLATTIRSAAPSLTDLRVTATPISSGTLRQPFTYVVTITNQGAGPATNVMLSEVLPSAYARLVNAQTSRGSISGSSDSAVNATLGTLAPGESATVQITLFPFAAGDLVSTSQVTSDQGDLQTLDNALISINAVSLVAPTAADLSLAVSVDNATPAVGDEVLIQVDLTNSGPGVASAIQVTALLPSGLEFVDASPEQGTYDASTGVWDVGNVRDNLSRRLTIRARVLNALPIPIQAEVTNVAEPDPDSTPNNGVASEDDIASLTLNDVPVADLGVTVATSPETPTAGGLLTYTITVANSSPSTTRGTGVVLTDTLPAGVEFVSATASQGTAANAGGVVTASLGDLAGGATATVVIVVRTIAAGTLVNSAQVQGTEPDLNTANDSVQTTTTVMAAPVLRPDLAVVVSDPGQVVLGQDATYTATVTNRGDATASSVVLNGLVPSGVLIVSVTTSRGTTSRNAAGFAADLGDLAPGESATVTLVVRPTVAGSRLATTFSLASAAGEVNLANNTATTQTLVTAADTTGPRVVNLQRYGYHMAPTRLVLSFDEPLDAARATRARGFTLTDRGPDGRFGTADDRRIAIQSAVYNAETRTVTLSPRKRLSVFRKYRLSIDASALSDTAGNPLGGDFQTRFDRSNLAGKFLHGTLARKRHASQAASHPKSARGLARAIRPAALARPDQPKTQSPHRHS